MRDDAIGFVLKAGCAVPECADVAARDPISSKEKISLKVVRVSSDADGITIDPIPPTKFVPEVPHAQLQFDDVAVAEDAILPGDGYDSYVKPFRTVEDLHVNAAILAYLVREARRLNWPQNWIERVVATLFVLERLSAEDPGSPVTHLGLAGALSIGTDLIGESEAFWQLASADAATPRWQRDRELLKVAGSAREQRTARAWERLRPVG